jgi:hypothetical protein
MLDRRTGETHPIDCMEYLSNIYGNRSQICCSKSKTYRDAQLESLFIPSRLSTRQSTKPSVGVNPQGRSTEKVKLLLNDSHLEPQAMKPQHHYGVTTWSSGNPNAKSKNPLPRAPNVEVVYDISPGTTTRVAREGSLIEGTKTLDDQV